MNYRYLFILLLCFASCKKSTSSDPVAEATLETGLIPATKEDFDAIVAIDGSFLNSLGSLEKLTGDKYTLSMHDVGDQKNTNACTPYATTYGMLSWCYSRIYGQPFVASPSF